MGYVNEVMKDKQLKRHVEKMSGEIMNPLRRMAKRILVGELGGMRLRGLRKLRLIVETGVDKGLGACVITAALMKNREEGLWRPLLWNGHKPKAGYLLSEHYNKLGANIV